MNALPQRQALSDAARWFARLGAAPDDPALQRQWLVWHNADPQHQWAWQRVAALQARLGQAQGSLGYGVLERAGQHGHSRGRRTLLKGLLLGAGLGALSWRGYRDAPVWLADVHTRVGEQRTLSLSDGSRLTLDTGSAVDIAFSAHSRLLILRAGEIFIETAKDDRPFIVNSRQGTMRALGTRFGVCQEQDRTRLSVFEHAVALSLAHDASNEVIVDSGQALSFDADHVLEHSTLAPSQDAWVNGTLVIDGWRLDRLVAELQRYRSGYLGCAQEIGHLRVSGAYSLKDIDLTLAAIARVLPVRVSRYTEYWTRLVPRLT